MAVAWRVTPDFGATWVRAAIRCWGFETDMWFFCFSAKAGDAIKAAAPQQLNRIKRLFFTISYSSFLFPHLTKEMHKRVSGVPSSTDGLTLLFVCRSGQARVPRTARAECK